MVRSESPPLRLFLVSGPGRAVQATPLEINEITSKWLQSQGIEPFCCGDLPVFSLTPREIPSNGITTKVERMTIGPDDFVVVTIDVPIQVERVLDVQNELASCLKIEKS